MFAFQLPEQARPLDRRCRASRGEFEHRQVACIKDAGHQRTDVQHPDEVTFDDQRDPEQGADPLFAQDRVHDVGVVDVGDVDRDPLPGDTTGESHAERDPHPAFDFLLDALGGPRNQFVGAVIEQQDRGRVDVKQLTDPHEQLVQQAVEPEL